LAIDLADNMDSRGEGCAVVCSGRWFGAIRDRMKMVMVWWRRWKC